MTDLSTHIAEIQEMFDGHLELTEQQIRSEFANLFEYDVPVDQARDTIITTFADESNIDSDTLFRSGETASEAQIATIDTDGNWGSYRVTVTKLFTPNSDSIDQVGLIADESGQTKFTKWSRAEHLPELKQGESYLIEDAVTDEYNGNYSLSLNTSTSVTELDSTVTDKTVDVKGAIIDLQDGSGLIKRCPTDECRYVLNGDGHCAEHGDVDGEFGLRLKTIVDTGKQTHNVIFQTRATEYLTGISIGDAIDSSATNEDLLYQMKAEFIGRYFSITGERSGEYVEVTGFDEVLEAQNVEATLQRAQSY